LRKRLQEKVRRAFSEAWQFEFHEVKLADFEALKAGYSSGGMRNSVVAQRRAKAVTDALMGSVSRLVAVHTRLRREHWFSGKVIDDEFSVLTQAGRQHVARLAVPPPNEANSNYSIYRDALDKGYERFLYEMSVQLAEARQTPRFPEHSKSWIGIWLGLIGLLVTMGGIILSAAG